MTILLAVSGKLGVGKDYVMEHLLLPRINSTTRVARMAFADHIKINVASQTGTSVDHMLSGHKSVELRKKLQIEGTENGRNKYGENIWIDTLRNWIRLRELRDGLDIVIITDCRFQNEVDYVESEGGLVIRVQAEDRNEIALRRESGGNEDLYQSIKNHSSETSLDAHQFRWVLSNEQGMCQRSQERMFEHILVDWYQGRYGDIDGISNIFNLQTKTLASK
jgi:hypothetical protein